MNECAFLHIVKFLFKVTVNNYIFTKIITISVLYLKKFNKFITNCKNLLKNN